MATWLPGAPPSRERRCESDAATAQEQHADEGLGGMKPEGASGDHAELGVEALDAAVGGARVKVSDDVFLVFADGGRGGDEGLELGAAGPGKPGVELAFGMLSGGQVEDVAQRLVKQIGSVERGVVSLNIRELEMLVEGELFAPLDDNEAGTLDGLGLLGRAVRFEPDLHLPAHFVDRVRGRASARGTCRRRSEPAARSA